MAKIGFKKRVGALTIELIADKILHIKLDSDALVTLEDMHGYMECIREEFGGEAFANLVEFGSLTNVTKEAREYAAQPESNELTIADAFILKSLSQRILGNFYLKMDKPVKPTKLFGDIESAREWLDHILLSEKF